MFPAIIRYALPLVLGDEKGLPAPMVLEGEEVVLLGSACSISLIVIVPVKKFGERGRPKNPACGSP